MLGNQSIMAFVPTVDAGRARPFYEQMLGLKVVGEDPYGVMFDANGVLLRMSVVGAEFKPAPFTIFGWAVKDVRAMADALVERGVSFERYGFIEQDKWGVWTSPDGAQIAWFKDVDGNTLSLAQL
ncbi:MAG TPA: VOC family protein [Puia sp.]|jgi:predicted enzyme related to lactoylglutathione lyase|nr:VOC family protein [Puia sp.]